MKVWVVRDAEPLPSDGGQRRLMRAGHLCEALAARGHDVTWFNSTFDHYDKRQRAPRSTVMELSERLNVRLLRAPGYPRNVSVRRILHNRAFARAFEDDANSAAERPDVIAVDIPTTESAASAVRVAERFGVPSVLSIRDLWPDFFASFVPKPVRPFAAPLLAPMRRQAEQACQGADVLVGISQAYLDWALAKAGRARAPSDAVVPLGYRREMSATGSGADAALAAMGVDPAKSIVAFVGTWGVTSDLETVARAAALLHERHDIVFAIGGRPLARDGLAERLAAMPNVVLPGWLDATQSAHLLDRAAIGLTPYQGTAPQGLPNKLFAYMSHGVFQVTTLGGEAADLLARDGLGVAVPGHDPAAMAAAIVSAVDGGGLAASRGPICAFFDMHFSHEHSIGRLAEIVETARRRTSSGNAA